MTGMSHLARVYRDSLALLTDLYELTMAYCDRLKSRLK
jgi:hypothetical protein